jgi:hypothetical protein
MAVALALGVVLMATACPTKSEIDRAALGSRELAHDVVAVEKTVGTLYATGHISLARKDSYADKLKLIATEGRRFNDSVVELSAQEKAGTLPKNAGALLRQNFAPILAAFNDLASGLSKKDLGDLAKHVGAVDAAIKKVD